MEFVTENEEQYILISKEADLKDLLEQILNKHPFAHLFKFKNRELFAALLESLKISPRDFEKKYYYHDANRKLHISESEFGYVWISTHGLVARKKITKNRALNACLNQYIAIYSLLEKAIEIVKDETVYDIDSYKFGVLSELSPAIFHNMTFYIEVFCKAYLSL